MKDWIKQFDVDDHFVMMALEAVGEYPADHAPRRLGRGRGLPDGRQSEFEGANLCTLGSIKDSSTLFTNFALDSARLHNLKARHLDEGLDDSKPIIFVDDFVGLGNQTIDIM